MSHYQEGRQVDSDQDLNSESSKSSDQESPDVQWKPLTSVQRRVVGVLVEKSKTTPDIYPMSLNAIKNGANQKSNRSPQMSLEEHEVEDVLYELRALGAVIEVHSGGRVPKYKHQLYEWLDVKQVELSVLAELLLRGEQTMGDLRARASRMDRIEGLTGLRPVFESLLQKNLVVELTPPGRGQMVTHNLYPDGEVDQIRKQVGSGGTRSASPTPSREPSNLKSTQDLEALKQEVANLRCTVDELKKEVYEIRELLN
ncbi:MAG: DUF480 domain-containing protein [Planctomycetota bacterium]